MLSKHPITSFPVCSVLNRLHSVSRDVALWQPGFSGNFLIKFGLVRELSEQSRIVDAVGVEWDDQQVAVSMEVERENERLVMVFHELPNGLSLRLRKRVRSSIIFLARIPRRPLL